MASSTPVTAAGAVVLRKSQEGREVLLVHRPKYDDWSFPKGKLEPGEHETAAAVREVLEETGLEIRLGLRLASQHYRISGGRSKRVHYWRGHVVAGDDVSGFVPNSEIDTVTWVPVNEARRRLTREDDGQLLDEASAHKRTRTLIVVRHGRALNRKSWQLPDPLRPLDEAGARQAMAIVPVLSAYGISRVISSPSTRCVDTVLPCAKSRDLSVEGWPGLGEEGFEDISLQQAARLLIALKEPTVVCSHRPVLPGLLEGLHVRADPLEPGEMIVIQHRRGQVLGTERHQALS